MAPPAPIAGLPVHPLLLLPTRYTVLGAIPASRLLSTLLPLLLQMVDSPWLVDHNGGFKAAKARTAPPKDAPDKAGNKQALEALTARLDTLQHILYAHDHRALLLVFQAMDAAGKDGTIKHVMSGVNPAGVSVTSFKQPGPVELAHDFLWRIHMALPPSGRIGIFNRSHYEDVLVTRVHPEMLAEQGLPHGPTLDGRPASDKFWTRRLRDIAHFERYLTHQNIHVIKFFLNVSKEEQRQRLLARVPVDDQFGVHRIVKRADGVALSPAIVNTNLAVGE